MQRRLCLVTGASAGIGAALARVYAKNGWDLALTARRADRLAALSAELRAAHGADCIEIAADLADPDAPERILREVETRGRTLDGLVNNAGYGGPPGLLADDWAAHEDFLRVMMTAPVHLARLALPGMKTRGFGRVINVASIAGMLPPARGQSLYGATKAFVIEASRAMHVETRGTGVHVTALCPGLTRTEFHDVAGLRKAADTAPALAWQSAETVAQAGYDACEANAAVRIPGAANKAVVTFARLLPSVAALALMSAASRAWERGE